MKKNFTKQDFYDLLTPNGDCLEWSLSKHKQGYGLTQVDRKTVKCHRLALELEGIDIKDNHVLHSCDNPSCCNPKHLRLGTHSDNMLDRTKRNRFDPKGSKNGNAKFSEQDIITIREHRRNGMSYQKIADKYGTNKSVIHKICNYISWKHI